MGMVSKAGTIVTDKLIEKWSNDAEHGIYPSESVECLLDSRR